MWSRQTVTRRIRIEAICTAYSKTGFRPGRMQPSCRIPKSKLKKLATCSRLRKGSGNCTESFPRTPSCCRKRVNMLASHMSRAKTAFRSVRFVPSATL